MNEIKWSTTWRKWLLCCKSEARDMLSITLIIMVKQSCWEDRSWCHNLRRKTNNSLIKRNGHMRECLLWSSVSCVSECTSIDCVMNKWVRIKTRRQKQHQRQEESTKWIRFDSGRQATWTSTSNERRAAADQCRPTTVKIGANYPK